MPDADNYITYSTKLDNSELEREIKSTKKQIFDLQKEIDRTAQKRIPLEDSARELGARLDAAKAKLAELEAGSGTAKQLEAASNKVDTLQLKFDKANDKLEQSDAYAAVLRDNLAASKVQAAGLEQKLAKSQSLKPLNDAADATEKRFAKLGKRIGTMFRKVFMFSILLSALRSVRSWFGEIIKTNDEAVSAISGLKGALLTMAQPIVEVAIPAFTKLINVLTKVIQIMANASSLLSGKRVQDSAKNAKALEKERKAISGVGNAAKKASGSLASFDEINKLNDNSSDGSGSSKSDSSISPDFSGFDGDMLQGELDKLTAILGGALFAVGAVLAFSGAKIPLGIALMAMGAAILYKEASMNWDKLPEQLRDAISGALVLVGMVALVVGLCLLLSWASPGIGLGLVAIGAASIASAAALNWDELGDTIAEKLAQIGTIIGPCIAVVGVLLCMTGNIPLGIGMIVAGAAIFGVSEAVLNWDELGSTLTEKLGNIATIIGGVLAVLGVILMLTGIAFPLGLSMVIAGSALLIGGSIAAQWDSVPNTVRDKMALILKVIGGFLVVLGVILLFTGVGVPLGLGLILAGAGLLGASAVAANWNFIVDKVQSCWASVKQYYNQHIKKYLSIEYWKEKASDIITGLADGIKGGLKEMKNAVSETISKAWDKAKNVFTGSSSSGVSVQASSARVYSADVPALAKGAVIPPNREFMAVLGDQSRGNNIEAPENLIRQIVREESGGSNAQMLSVLQAILQAIEAGQVMEVDRQRFAKIVHRLNSSEGSRVGVRLVNT